MNFLNNSSKYSEEYVIKSELVGYISQYNKFLENYNLQNFDDTFKLIPNNNKKYFIFMKKISNTTAIMYYFPSETSKQYYSSNLLIKNTISDFFVECDIVLQEPFYILEGYLYNNKQNYLISDILFIGNNIVNEPDYSSRFNLLYNFYNLYQNEFTNIQLHPYTSENMISLFLNNFIWKHEIVSIETIFGFYKEQKYIIEPFSSKTISSTPIFKIIEKTNKSEIYKVYNISTNDYEGLLYIKTLQDSIYMYNLTQNCDTCTLECVFNSNFQKWSAIVSF